MRYFVFENTFENSKIWDKFLLQFPYYTVSIFILEFFQGSKKYSFGLLTEKDKESQIKFLESISGIKFYDSLDSAKIDFPNIE